LFPSGLVAPGAGSVCRLMAGCLGSQPALPALLDHSLSVSGRVHGLNLAPTSANGWACQILQKAPSGPQLPPCPPEAFSGNLDPVSLAATQTPPARAAAAKVHHGGAASAAPARPIGGCSYWVARGAAPSAVAGPNRSPRTLVQPRRGGFHPARSWRGGALPVGPRKTRMAHATQETLGRVTCRGVATSSACP
jgi:hypothetical protein